MNECVHNKMTKKLFESEKVISSLVDLLKITSPTGYTKDIIKFLEKEIKEIGYPIEVTPKGNLIATVKGKDNTNTIGLSAHVDTLGLMVRSINADGTLSLTTLGGPLTPTLDGEYCEIITRDKKIYTGTILSNTPSIHVYKDATTKERDIDNLVVKIDQKVNSKKDVQKLGIRNGDIVAYDPKINITCTNYIKARFLDDKASVAILINILKTMKENNIIPAKKLKFIFTTYEEVGHGASWIPEDITEFLAVDMGAIGDDLDCTEYDVSICAKDSSGPYDYDMTTNLIHLADENNLNYAVDIYPMYGSDASAALRGGANIKAALIGPGVSNSHGMERTHVEALENTFNLLVEYIKN